MFENVLVFLLSVEELDRTLTELSFNIEFLEAQIQADRESYSFDALSYSQNRILTLKKRAENLKHEIQMGKNNHMKIILDMRDRNR